MRKYLSALFFATVAMSPRSVHTATPAQEPAPPVTSETIKDIMISTITPSASYIWDSVSVEISPTGVKTKSPQTEKEWEELRKRTTTLLEGTNLLVVPGRRVAKPGEKAAKPDIELSPEEIETLIEKDRDAWLAVVRRLYDASQKALKAVEAKDANALMTAGGNIYEACTNCHDKYRSPKGQGVLPR